MVDMLCDATSLWLQGHFELWGKINIKVRELMNV